ncbi:unnamed protein product [Meganyctiphanes norvegica]|uniref:Uncharacterized protein n=1 Tax=Meganyctiphanes norvegica TaxID=48144 RepID=A0AAV2SAP7_MEGNR
MSGKHDNKIWFSTTSDVVAYFFLFFFYSKINIFYLILRATVCKNQIVYGELSFMNQIVYGELSFMSTFTPPLFAATSRFDVFNHKGLRRTSSSKNIFPVCEDEEIKVNCLSRDELVSASGLLGKLQDVLLPALEAHAVQYSCGHHEHIYMNIPQLVLLMQPHAKKSSSNLDVGIRGLGKLFDLNTHWGVVSKREGEVLLGLAAANFPSQYICHLRNKIAALFYWVLAVVISAFLMWLSYVTYRHYKLKADAEKQQVMELVDQILNVLGGLGGGPGGPGKDYVALNHVRDSLIAPRDKKTKHTIWGEGCEIYKS